jgi:uncharacterized small protein (DUF1192 family)
MCQTCLDAKTEIERLQTQLTQERKVFHETQWRQLKETEAEVERLKADKDVQRSQARNASYEGDIAHLEAEIERLKAENARLKEIEIKYDQFISGAFV